MTVSTTTSAPAVTARVPRGTALAGAGFVASVLAGNSLTESVSGTGHLGELIAWAESPVATVGLALELVGFVLLLVFVPVVAGRGVGGDAARIAVLAGGVAAAVKVGSAALVLGALHARTELDEPAAAALMAANDAAFVLFWIGFGLFVATGAHGLAAAGAVGRVLGGIGRVLGGLCVAAGVAGAVLPALAVPIPFLLTLVWTVIVSLRLALPGGRADVGGRATA